MLWKSAKDGMKCCESGRYIWRSAPKVLDSASNALARNSPEILGTLEGHVSGRLWVHRSALSR